VPIQNARFAVGNYRQWTTAMGRELTLRINAPSDCSQPKAVIYAKSVTRQSFGFQVAQKLI